MPNILSSIGKSGAVGDFVKEARAIRKQEFDIANENTRIGMDQERLGIERSRLGNETLITEEQIRAAQLKNKADREAYEQMNMPVIHNPDMWGNKGVNSVVEEWMKTTGRGEIDMNGNLIYKNKHLSEFANEAEKNPMIKNRLVTADLQSTGAMYKSVKAAMNDPKAFKALKEQMPEITQEQLPELFEYAEMEYARATNSFRGITEKDKIMREEAADKQEEQIRHNKEVEFALKMNARANGTRADAAADKPEYTRKQALARTSQIDSAIARLKTTGSIDTATAIQNPNLAFLADTKDPEAVKQAIVSLQQERDYVSQFLPKSGGGTVQKIPKTLKEALAMGYKDTGKRAGGKKVYTDGTTAWVE